MVSHNRRPCRESQPTRQVHRQPAVLKSWLVERGHGVSGNLRMERLGSGWSTITSVAADEDGRSWLVREPRPGTAHDVRREANVMMALAGSGVPVPRVIGNGTARGGLSFLVMERIDGQSLQSEDAADRLTPEARRGLGRQMVKTMARLHALDPARLGIPLRAGPFLDHHMDALIDVWTRCGSGSTHDSSWRAVLARLVERRPVRPPLRPSILHGDFRLSNILVRDGQIIALLDWELSTAGDAIADLAWLLDDWRSSDEPAIWLPTPTRAGGFPTRKELIDEYRDLTGFSVAHLGYYRGFMNWRAATLLQGVAHRRRLGFEDDLRDGVWLDGTVAELLMTAAAELNRSDIVDLQAVSTLPKIRPRRVMSW
ncbi:MAG TPA: phosphotransferase family protein [Mycobacterium sp.]